MSDNDFYEILKYLIPQVAILFLVYMFLENWLRKERLQGAISRRDGVQKLIVPNQVHALERMTLYIERISPAQLIPRMHQQGLSAKEFQYLLTKEIADEYEHNLSQQLYLSTDTWTLITLTKDKMIQDIVQAMQGMDDASLAKDLAYKMIENNMSGSGKDLCSKSIVALKKDLQNLMK